MSLVLMPNNTACAAHGAIERLSIGLRAVRVRGPDLIGDGMSLDSIQPQGRLHMQTPSLKSEDVVVGKQACQRCAR